LGKKNHIRKIKAATEKSLSIFGKAFLLSGGYGKTLSSYEIKKNNTVWRNKKIFPVWKGFVVNGRSIPILIEWLARSRSSYVTSLRANHEAKAW